MFDSLFVNCPNCNKIYEFQSKGGVCNVEQYTLSNVPIEFFCDVYPDIAKCSCGTNFTIKTQHSCHVEIC